MLYTDKSNPEKAIRAVKIENIEFLNSYKYSNNSDFPYIVNIVTKNHERDWGYKNIEDRDRVFNEIIELVNKKPTNNLF
jgi:hypothetical protein